MDLPPAGILNVDKAAGWTSHDVVAALRGILGVRRVGHGGTLDPFATGVLPILYGAATRLVQHLHGMPKTYLAEMVLGSETATDDLEGEPLATEGVPELADDSVRRIFATFLGPQEQRPPAFSAITVRGERAYARARRGGSVQPPPRPIEIYDLALVERGERCIHFLVTCSAGTYVRALARDLGRALGTRAHLGALRRIAAGGLWVEEAVTVEKVRELAAANALGPLVYAPDVAALDLDGLVLAAESARRLRQGQLVVTPGHASGTLRAYDVDGEFIGIARGEGERAWPHTILSREVGPAREHPRR